MNRALPLLLLIAVAGAGLTFFALETGHRGPRSAAPTDGVVDPGARPSLQTPKATENTSGGQDLAAITSDLRSQSVTGTGPSKVWEIIPMNSVGQPVPDATITATRASEVRTGTGRTKWQSLPAGAWELVIESEGNPTWQREVVLVAGKSMRTAARLGEEVRIQGTVVDTNGDPIVRTPVFLLPPGVRHPSRSDMKHDTSRPRDPAQAQNGAITAKLDGNGRFSAKLPKAGPWRVSIGVPEDARWTQSRATELTHGGPDVVTATIPAKATLQITFSSRPEERPRQISAYIYDAKMAVLVDRGRKERFVDSGMSIAEAQKAAKKAAMAKGAGGGAKQRGDGRNRKGRNGTARTTKDEMRAAIEGGEYSDGSDGGEHRGGGGGDKLFEPGWRMVKSIRVDEAGSALFTDMPGGADLRFLFVRGRERIITAGSYRLADGKLSMGTVSLPPLDTTPPQGPDARGSIKIRVGGERDGVELREPGVVWRF